MIFTIVRKTMGCLFSLLFLVLILTGALAAAVYFLLPTYLEYKLENQTGFRADFGDISLDIMEGALEIRDAKIENPDSFPEPVFIDFNRIKVDLRPMSLFGERCIFQAVIVEIKEGAYVTRSDSENNIAAFIKALETTAEEGDGEEVEKDIEVEEEPFQFLIERLAIKVDSVKVANYSGQPPRVQNHDAGIDIELRDVTAIKEIVRPLVAELSNKGLVFVIKGVLESLNQDESYKGLLQWTVEAIEDSVKTIIDGADETSQVLKKIFEKLLKK